MSARRKMGAGYLGREEPVPTLGSLAKWAYPEQVRESKLPELRRLAPKLEAYSYADVSEHELDVQAVMAECPDGHYVAIPTLLAIGLGPQLAELERICAEAYQGKHAGGCILEPGEGYHLDKAISHLDRGGSGERDPDSGARHLVHAAARLLMAAACLDDKGVA